MIIWLASYPRSGNTLLRTVLHSTMDIGCYDSEHLVFEPDNQSTKYTGGISAPPGTVWPEFYQHARTSPETYFIKTHFPPKDDQPAIYMVRDGRLACWSYLAFHHSYTHMPDVSLQDIVMGYSAYGNWTTHFRAWNARPSGPRLLVRYEDLVGIETEGLQKIADFLKHTGPIKAWENPFNELQRVKPQFFREGKSLWSRPEAWSDLTDDVFRLLHGSLMAELGYATAEEMNAPLAAVAETERESFGSLLTRASATAISYATLWHKSEPQSERVKSLIASNRRKSERLAALKSQIAKLKTAPAKKNFMERLGFGKRKS